MKMFIDCGHGGNDIGASVNGILEKNINLMVGQRVKYHLERHSQTVIMSRTNDTFVSLTERSNMSNNNNVDIALSIHCNSFSDTSTKGVEIFTYGTGNREMQLAREVLNAIKKDKLYSVDRGIKQGNLHMVSEIKTASVLLEMGFISNDVDRKLILENIENFSIAITKGLLSYYNIAYKVENQSPPKPTSQLFFVQVGAYSNRENAQNKVNELKKLGIDSYIKI